MSPKSWLRRAVSPASPLALIALPILAALALAWKGMEAEQAAAAARQAEAAAERLAAAAEKLETAAQAFAAKAAALTAAARTTEDLHGLVARGDLALAAVHHGERRSFPPEDSGGVTATEARALAALGPALAAARARLTPGGVAWRRAAAPGGPALLVCRRDEANAADYCAAVDERLLRDALTMTMVSSRPGGDDWRFTLRGPDDDPAARAAATIAERGLSGPLAGWRLSISSEKPAPGWYGALWNNAGALYVLIGAPSAALWAAGAWRFHQSRRAQLDEGRRRIDLTARLSHDLRTPLANLRLYADLIRRRAADPAAVTDYAAVLEAEIDRLDAIAAAAVAAAAGDAAAETLRPAQIDPAAAAAELAARNAAGLAAAGCAFTLSHSGGGACGGFDAAALARIWSNLLDNAGKFAAGRPVEATADYADGVLTLTVRDHGPGLSGADPARRGARLGLAATARLAALHGGDLALEDARPGLRAVVRLRSITATTPERAT